MVDSTRIHTLYTAPDPVPDPVERGVRMKIFYGALVLLFAIIFIISVQFDEHASFGYDDDDRGPDVISTSVEQLHLSKANITGQEMEMREQVSRCAKEITGDDSPRKLDPALRAKVMDCAMAYMPEIDTDSLLKESQDRLLASAKTVEEQADAQQVIAKSQEDSSVSPATPE